jgi:hypothetical protein
MTWATIQPASGTGRHRAGGYGLILLAPVLLLVLGWFNLIDGWAVLCKHGRVRQASGWAICMADAEMAGGPQ